MSEFSNQNVHQRRRATVVDPTEDKLGKTEGSFQELRIEPEPVTDANVDSLGPPKISETEREVTLVETEPVVDKRAVPHERVGHGKDVVTVEQTVSDEEIEVPVDVQRGWSEFPQFMETLVTAKAIDSRREKER